MTTGRNQACPCGSGRKFKKCCEKSTSISKASHPSSNAKQPSETYRKFRQQQLLDEYRQRPSYLVLNELMGLASTMDIIEMLYPLACKNDACTTVLTHLIELLRENRRYQDAAYFCARLVKQDSTVASWYLVAKVVSYQNDLLSLNISLHELLQLKASVPILATVQTATMLCARRLPDAAQMARSMEPARNDPFSNTLALHVAVQANDYELLRMFLLEANCEKQFNPRSQLWAQAIRLSRVHLLRILNNKDVNHE
jgi:hypothetical protein